MRARAGFTLVEILVAIVVTSLLLTTVYGVFLSVSAARQRIEADSQIYHRARVIFDRLGREVHGAYWSVANTDTRFNGGLDDQGRPYLELSTTAATPQSGGGGIVLIRYLLRSEPQDGRQRELVRLERPLFSEDFADRDALRLAAGISDLTLRFYGDGGWQESWEAGIRGGPPQLVEVTLTQAGEYGEVPATTIFKVGL